MSATSHAPLKAAPVPAPAATSAPGSLRQRKGACGGSAGRTGECAECGREKLLRRRPSGDAAPTVPPVVYEVLRSPGEPLDAASRSFMEPRFGHDFGRVRVHADGRAGESARAVGALAYTVGRHIVFAPGRYAPRTSGGRGLLAHELAHVVQQGQRPDGPAPQYALEVGPAGDRYEREADAVAEGVLRGQSVGPAPGALPGPRLQRFPLGALIPLIGGGLATLYLLFSEGRFTERELLAYLEHLATRRKIEGGYFSDDKARAVVKRWEAGQSEFNLDAGYTSATAEISAVDLKRLLIKEMLDGMTTDGDEKAILKILEKSSDDEVLKLLDPAQGVSVQALDDNIQGENHVRFAALLERRFPKLGAPHVPRQGELSCDARQAIMLDYARQQAEKIMAAALARLSDYQTADPNTRRTKFKDVHGAVECYFPGAKDADLTDVKGVLEKTPTELAKAQYRCFPEGAESVPVEVEGVPQRKGEMNRLNVPRNTPGLRPFWKDPATGVFLADPRTFIPPFFFTTLGPVQQAVTLIHEAVHGIDFAIEDRDYGNLSCGVLKLNEAKTNAESFALLALKLAARAPGTVAFKGAAVSVTLGNFRNTGPISRENECEICPDLPGLGPDTSTALNIMELRGDITGHRAGVEYDFSRTKERAIWQRAGDTWTLLQYAPPAMKDDRFSSDEDVTPKNNHIYVIDGPGLQDPDHPVPDPAAEEAVYRGTFVESVRARVDGGPWAKVSNDFPWHSITWLEKVEGKWGRKPGANEIAPGSITVGKALPYGPGDYPLPAKGKNTGRA